MFSDIDDFSEAAHLCLYPAKKTRDVVKVPKGRQTEGSTCTALPLTSEPMEAAVAIVLGTVAVLVSQMCI